MVIISFVPLRIYTVWVIKSCVSHVCYEKWTTVITSYGRSSQHRSYISTVKKYIHILTYWAQIYTDIYAHTYTYIYNAHVITFMLNGTSASAFEPTYSKRTQIHVSYVWSGLLETCRENEYRENIDTRHILVSGPILYFRVMTTV